MSWKSLTCVTMFCALLAGQAMAVPTIQVAGTPNAGNVDWTVSFTPDPTLLNAGNGSLGIELALEFSEALVDGSLVISPDFDETINGTPIENPGLDPYINDITEGFAIHEGVTSVMGNPGNINAIFAALGSTKFMDPGSKLAMTFSTVGTTGKVTWDGFIAQDPNGPLVDISGMEEAGGTPLLLGDANNDLAVTGADINIVLANFGNVGPPFDGTLLGDANDDGSVTGADINVVLSNFGNVYTPPGALALSTNVPEPASALLTLAAVGLVGATAYRRRRLV